MKNPKSAKNTATDAAVAVLNAIFTQQIQVKIRAAPGIRPGKRSKIAKIQAVIQAAPEFLPVLLSNDNKSGKSSSSA